MAPPSSITLQQVAESLGLPLVDLQKLAGAAHRLYRVTREAKSTGGLRTIEAPYPRLKAVQRGLCDKFLNQIQVDEALHGRPGTSQLSAAARHIRQPMVITMDLASFFPSVTAHMVVNALVSVGFDTESAESVTRLCTRRRRLPQGAPTSAALARLVVSPVVARIREMAATLSPHYEVTQFVDDLCLSGPIGIQRSIPLIRKIWERSGFKVQSGKTKVMTRSQEQEVLGVFVNDGLRPTHDFIARLATVRRNLDVDDQDPVRRGMENWVHMIASAAVPTRTKD